MGPWTRLLGRRVGAVTQPRHWQEMGRPWASSFFFRSLATRLSESTASSSNEKASNSLARQRKVAVFWDLDNKPPKRVSPFDAAIRLREMAGEFGQVVDVVAYANHHAFSHIPTWIHEERKHRKVLDQMEASGEVKPTQPYVCKVCGAKKKTNVLLTKHFKMLHEREQNKRMNRLDSLKSKKKKQERYWKNNSEKMAKYTDAARSIIIPGVGYGLMQDIKRAGVKVKTVKDEPQAADIALKSHMMKSINRGVNCICLVSDDTDFKAELMMAREKRLHTVVVGDLRILDAYADTYFSWAEVASGRAEQKAKLVNRQGLVGEVGQALGSNLDTAGGSGPTKVTRISELVSESDVGSDSDDEQVRWQLVDKFVDGNDEHFDFDSFSDEVSESESESEGVLGARVPQIWQGSLTNSKFGVARMVPKGVRGIKTRRQVVSDGFSFNRISSQNEKGPSVSKFGMQRPEKLHDIFTTLESPNKEHSKKGSPWDSSDSFDNRNDEHLSRVEDILKTTWSEKSGEKRSKEDRVEQLKWVQDGFLFHASGVDAEPGGIKREWGVRTSAPRYKERYEEASKQKIRSSRISREQDGQASTSTSVDISRDPHFVDDLISASSDKEGYADASKKKVCHRTSKEQDELISAGSDEVGLDDSSKQKFRTKISMKQDIPVSAWSDKEEEQDTHIPRTRTRTGKSGLRERKVLKVVSEGPPPFYITGFAPAESQSACDAVNKYYSEFWGDEYEFFIQRKDRKIRK